MTVKTRKLRWRVLRGADYLDLVEEREGHAPLVFVGLVNGREAVRTPDRHAASKALIAARADG